MRAAVVTTFGGPEAVEVVEAELPEPAARQVRIKVAAATLNPVDAGVRQGVFGVRASGSGSAGMSPGPWTRRGWPPPGASATRWWRWIPAW